MYGPCSLLTFDFISIHAQCVEQSQRQAENGDYKSAKNSSTAVAILLVAAVTFEVILVIIIFVVVVLIAAFLHAISKIGS